MVDVVLLPIQIDQDRPPIIGDLHFDSADDELVFDFHFCVLSAWGRQGGDTKMAGACQPRTMHSQDGRTGSRVLITPLPKGRVGSYSILAHVRTQAAIFFYLNGKARFDLDEYNDLQGKTKSRSMAIHKQWHTASNCHTPAQWWSTLNPLWLGRYWLIHYELMCCSPQSGCVICCHSIEVKNGKLSASRAFI